MLIKSTQGASIKNATAEEIGLLLIDYFQHYFQ
jgi:hypothetical protein